MRTFQVLKNVAVVAAVSVVLPTFASAQNQTIDFEGAPAGLCNAIVPNGYAGFNWSNFGVIAPGPSCNSVSGYVNGIVSGTQVGFTRYAQTAMLLQGANPFRLVSGWFTAAWNTGLQARVEGFLGGVSQFVQLLSPSYSAPTLYALNTMMVDEVRFIGVGGSDADANDSGSGTHLVMDDLIVSVPEPSSVLLILSGLLALFALKALKDRRSNVLG